MSTQLTDILDGVNYKELKGSNVIHGDINRITATRVFRTAWADRLKFVRKMVGEITLGSDGSTVINQPKQHPEMPGLFATGYVCEPYHDSSRIVAKTTSPEVDDPIDYDFAKVTIRYDVSSGQFSTGDPGNPVTLFTEEVRISAQMMQIPGQMFVYSGAAPPQPVEQNVGILVGTVEDSVVFHRAANNKRATVKALVGSLNNATFLDSPSGSVMFMGADSRRNITTDGIQFWELKYAFKTRVLSHVTTQEDSWQKIWKQGAGWRTILREYDTTLGPYPYGDFNLLFT